ncbi:hypothetical protein BGX21_008615 [Mortierella sp. AD011]|nr:hypothetical protein BGX20_001308 [Mortierella sp. AD010]KAF9397682.1 hypothetical protein BGX21_008615 [Mortierella sp. AD011]
MARRFQIKKKKRSIIVKPRDTSSDGISLIQTAYGSNTEETASHSPAPNPNVNLKENPASKPKKLILRRPKTGESSGHDRKSGYRTSRLYSQVVSSTRRQQVNQPPLRDSKRPTSISTILNSISLPSNTRQQQPLPLFAPHKTQSEAYEHSPFNLSHNRPIGKKHHCMFLKYVDDFNLIPKNMLHSSDDKYFTIYDLYPKSTVHLLVLPRTHVEKLEDLSGEDGITIIKELQERGNRVIAESLKLYPYLKFSMGFHIIPSML